MWLAMSSSVLLLAPSSEGKRKEFLSRSVPAFPFRKDSSFSDEPFGNGVFLLQGQNPNHVDLQFLTNLNSHLEVILIIGRNLVAAN